MFEKIYFCENIKDLALESGNYLLLIAEKTDVSQMSFSDTIVVFGAIFPRVVFGETKF